MVTHCKALVYRKAEGRAGLKHQVMGLKPCIGSSLLAVPLHINHLTVPVDTVCKIRQMSQYSKDGQLHNN